MNSTFTLVFLFISFNLFCQDMNPFDEVHNVKAITENDLLSKDDSLKALEINFHGKYFENAIVSIRNNTQLKGIKLYNPTQEFIINLSYEHLDSLSHLIIEKFEGDSLLVPSFSKLNFFEINSDSLVYLNLSNANLIKLTTLNIDTDILVDLKTDTEYPYLDILNLHTPRLKFFLFENTPNLNYLSLKCSLNRFPTNLCNNDNLIGILIWNYGPIKIDNCLKKKIKVGFESSLIVYKDFNETILEEIYSKQ